MQVHNSTFKAGPPCLNNAPLYCESVKQQNRNNNPSLIPSSISYQKSHHGTTKSTISSYSDPSVFIKAQQQHQEPPGVALQTRAKLRSGKWTKEEEKYALLLIQQFKLGLLTKPEVFATSLRSWLAKKLNCCPMRISKKFAGACSLGKTPYKKAFLDMSSEEVEALKLKLEEARVAFIKRISTGSISKNQKSRKHANPHGLTKSSTCAAKKKKSVVAKAGLKKNVAVEGRTKSCSKKTVTSTTRGRISSSSSSIFTTPLSPPSCLGAINESKSASSSLVSELNFDFEKALQECVGVSNQHHPIASADGSLFFSEIPLFEGHDDLKSFSVPLSNGDYNRESFDAILLPSDNDERMRALVDVPSLEEITGSPTAVYDIFHCTVEQVSEN